MSGIVLNRKTRHTRTDAQPDISADSLRLVGISGLKIRIHGEIGCRGDLRDVSQHGIARDHPSVVRQPTRERKARTGRREGFKAEVLQISRGTRIPWVRDNKTTTLMKFPEPIAPRNEI